MNLITEQEVFTLAFNRNLSVGLLKPTQILVATETWFGNWVSPEFYKEVVDNPDNYEDFIEDYLKPLLAWSVLYNNYEYLILNITDKGIVQMLVEGTANIISRDNKWDAKFEIKNTCYTLLKRLLKYCEAEKISNNPLFTMFEQTQLIPSIIKFQGKPSLNNIPY